MCGVVGVVCASCGGMGVSSYKVFRVAGLILVLEHRYFGMSSPFEDLSTDNLRFLSVSQALADLANFHSIMSDKMNITNKNPWISVGGSYPGALSAW